MHGVAIEYVVEPTGSNFCWTALSNEGKAEKLNMKSLALNLFYVRTSNNIKLMLRLDG